MDFLKKTFAWFSKQKIAAKLIIIVVLFISLCCLISVPVALLSPSTPTPDISSNASNSVDIPDDSGSEQSNQSPSNTPEPTETDIPTETPAPTNTPVPTNTKIPTNTPDPNLINPGTYLVGSELKPGIYTGIAGPSLLSSCYWERLKDITGSFDAILANDNSIGRFYIEIKDTDYALTTGCELLYLETIPEHEGEYPSVIQPGTYLVSNDIRPGTYKGQAGADIMESCYWARLRSVSGGLDSILANSNSTGQYYIKVLASDFALTTNCELEFVSE